jgi:glutathione S-transferase
MFLYDGGRTPNTRRVRIFLAEKGVEVPMEHIDIAKDEHKTAAFTRLNPLQRIPSLVLDDGAVISESVAICRYFEELHPAPPLFGRDAKEKAMVEMWNRRVELGLFSSIAAVVRHGYPYMAAMEVPQVPEWAAVNRGKVEGQLRFLDGALAGSAFIAGEAFSIADITLLCGIDFMRLPKIALPGDCAHLRRWHAAVSARPSASA